MLPGWMIEEMARERREREAREERARPWIDAPVREEPPEWPGPEPVGSTVLRIEVS